MSRNSKKMDNLVNNVVAPREGRVSRNSVFTYSGKMADKVAPREGRVSRNSLSNQIVFFRIGRAPRGACE